MIDLHLVDECHVELVEDQRLGEVPGEFGMALHLGNRPGAEPFIGDPETSAIPSANVGISSSENAHV